MCSILYFYTIYSFTRLCYSAVFLYFDVISKFSSPNDNQSSVIGKMSGFTQDCLQEWVID